MAHSVGNAVEKAYWRTDLFEKRRQLLQLWANYLDDVSGTPVPLRDSCIGEDERDLPRDPFFWESSVSGTTGNPPGWEENQGPTDVTGEVAPLSDGLLSLICCARQAKRTRKSNEVDDLESLNRLLLSLREISRREDDQRLSAAGNVRAKYIDTLRSTLNYLYPRTNLHLEAL